MNKVQITASSQEDFRTVEDALDIPEKIRNQVSAASLLDDNRVELVIDNTTMVQSAEIILLPGPRLIDTYYGRLQVHYRRYVFKILGNISQYNSQYNIVFLQDHNLVQK